MSDPTINGGNLPQVNVTGQNRQKIRQDLLKGIEFAKRAGTDYSELQAKLNQFDAELAAELGAEKNTDTAKFTNQPATEADNLRRENEKYRKEKDLELVAKSKNYANAVQDFEDLQKEFKLENEKLNKMKKKERAAALKDKNSDYNKVAQNLVLARKKIDAAKAELGGDKGVATANRYNREEATKADDAAGFKNTQRIDSQKAAKREIEDRIHSKEGKEAILNKARELARGKADHKLSKAERRKRQEEVKKETGVTSNSVARRIQRLAEKDLRQLEKERFLGDGLGEKDPVIYIGDKKDYKKAKANISGFDKKKPQITHMSEDTYAAARRIAASEGLDLPENATFLNKDQALSLQEIMMDISSNMGSRGDLNESRGVAKQYKGVSAHDVRMVMEATNVDPQKDYKALATAIGAAVTLGQSTIGRGVTKGVQKLVTETISGGSLIDNAIDKTGHGIGKGITRSYLKDFTKPDYLKIFENILDGAAIGTIAGAAMNNDQNKFAKGKGPIDAIYNELSGLNAFKKTSKTARQIFAKVLADTTLTKEQKLAYMEAAMGNGGPKLNNRELVGLYIAIKAHNPDDAEPIKENDIIPELEQLEAWDVNANGFTDATGNKLNIENSTLIVNDQVTDQRVEQNEADGLAYDSKVVNQDKANTAKTFEEATRRNENDRLINQNRIEGRSQYTIADEKGETRVDLGSGTYEAPDNIWLKDNSNDRDGNPHVNEYAYQKLSQEEIKANGFNDNGPYYKVVSVTTDNGEPITQTKNKIFKLKYSETIRYAYRTEENKNGETIKRQKIKARTPHYTMEAADNFGKSSSVYSKTGAHPKKKA